VSNYFFVFFSSVHLADYISAEIIKKIYSHDIKVIGTATTIKEAKQLEENAAVINSTAAVSAGAIYLDSSLCGLGLGSGNYRID